TASNEQFSGIKYLVFDHRCGLDELIAILSYTPQLYRLSCKQVNEPKKCIVKDALNVILGLIRVFIAKCYAKFETIAMFLTTISPQLEVLRINRCTDVTDLGAYRWERIISQHLLHLNMFKFTYEVHVDEDFETSVGHERLNEFNSLFWMKRR
ncbi:unnamed protein product, partial [Rotaria sp. Silwood2]